MNIGRPYRTLQTKVVQFPEVETSGKNMGRPAGTHFYL